MYKYNFFLGIRWSTMHR